MGYSTKNKILMGVLFLLVLANLVTMAVFWMGNGKPPLLQKGSPADYLVKELGFDGSQEKTFLELVKEHRTQAGELRQQVATAKDNFFKLLQQPGLTDSEKKAAAANISLITEQLDLLTFDHFKKVRDICHTDQQKKFDMIIRDVIRITGGPGDFKRPPGPPPPGEKSGGPPPGADDGPPPPH